MRLIYQDRSYRAIPRLSFNRTRETPMPYSPLSVADQYAEILINNQEAAYYAQVPLSIFHCTYLEEQKDGSSVRKKLSANAIALYTLMRGVSGVNSACWMSTQTMGEMIGRSTGSVSKAKNELMQPMEQLGGKPLIEVTTKHKRHKGSSGSTHYHSITITFVWPENNAFMALKKHMKRDPLGPVEPVDNPDALSTIERENGARSTIETASPGSRSTIETNNRTYRKNPTVSTEEPTAGAVGGCSSIDTFSVMEDHAKMVEHAETQMKKFGCDDNFILEMKRRFPPQQIIEAGVYTARQLQRKRIGNRYGYLRNAIEQGREWHNSSV